MTYGSATPPPKKSKFLLKIDTLDLMNSEIENPQYWLFSIVAAWASGERAMKLLEGATSSWKDITANGKFTLPTTPPPPEEKLPMEPTLAPARTQTHKARKRSPYAMMKDNISTAKAKAAQQVRRKKQKASEGDTNFLQ